MKRAADGSFAPISWDDALSEIGAKVQEIIAEAGPEALAIIQDPRPSGKYYSKRFMNALGSPNVYTHAAACNLSKESGIQEATGAQNFSVDFPNTKMVVFIGRSYGDGIRPSSVKSLAGRGRGRGAGGHRAIRASTTPASLLLTGCLSGPALISRSCSASRTCWSTRDLYDHAFVEQSAVGFAEFAAQADRVHAGMGRGASATCRPIPSRRSPESLAARRTGLRYRAFLARGVRLRAIKTPSRRLARCAAVNALLGCWGAEGRRAASPPRPRRATWIRVKFPEAPRSPAAKRLGDAEYPLALSRHRHQPGRAARRRSTASSKGVFFYNSNAVQGYAQPAEVARGAFPGKARGHHRRADVRDGSSVRLRAARVHVPGAPGASRVHRRQETLRGHAHAASRAHPSRNEAVRRDLHRPGRGVRRGRVLPVHGGGAWADAQLATRGRVA